MKRILLSLIALGAVLASCQVPFSGGSLKVVLPGAPAARALQAGDSVRLQLTRNGVIVPLAGGDFLENVLSGQTVSIEGLPPGPGYVLYVSTGRRDSGESFYRTDLFQKSDAFEISAGVDTAVTVTLASSRFSVLEAASNAAHAVTVLPSDGSKLYYLNGNDLSQDSASPGTVKTGYAPSGVQVQGLGHDDGSTLWLNTDQGVSMDINAPPSTAKFPAPNMTDSNGDSISPSVTNSGKIVLGGNQLSYYYGVGLTAGVEVGSATEWSTMQELLDLSQDLKDKLKGQIIRGVASAANGSVQFGVLATSIGAFSVGSGMLSDKSQLTDALTSGKFGGVSIDLLPSDTSLLVGPVSAYSDGSTGGLIFAGTGKGLYAGAVNASGTPASADGTLGLVSGTLGLNITELTTLPSTFNGKVITAAYSASTRELLLLNGTQIAARYSAFEGLPSGEPTLALYQVGTTLYLAASGSDATVKLDVTPQ